MQYGGINIFRHLISDYGNNDKYEGDECDGIG